MDLDKELVEALLMVNWFSQCGKDILIDDVIRAKSISNVKKAIQSTQYENTVLANQSDFTSSLFVSHRDEYNKWWNKLVKQFKSRYISQLEVLWRSRLETLGLYEKYIMDDIAFNVLGIAILGAYKEQISMPAFYQKMFEIYKSGHLICGWKGKKDSGCFIVY